MLDPIRLSLLIGYVFVPAPAGATLHEPEIMPEMRRARVLPAQGFARDLRAGASRAGALGCGVRRWWASVGSRRGGGKDVLRGRLGALGCVRCHVLRLRRVQNEVA